MTNWAIGLGLCISAAAVAMIIRTSQHYDASKRHVMAGSFGSFTAGLLFVAFSVLPPGPVTTITQAYLLVITFVFYAAEVVFWRQDRRRRSGE